MNWDESVLNLKFAIELLLGALLSGSGYGYYYKKDNTAKFGFNVRFESGWGWRFLWVNGVISFEGVCLKCFISLPVIVLFIFLGFWKSKFLVDVGRE